MSLVTLAALRIVPARLRSGLAGTWPGPLRLELGERERAVWEVSQPERAARAAFVWGFVVEGEVDVEGEGGVKGETGSGSMKGSAGKESWGRVGVEPGGGSLA